MFAAKSGNLRDYCTTQWFGICLIFKGMRRRNYRRESVVFQAFVYEYFSRGV